MAPRGRSRPAGGQGGYALAALLVAVSVMAVLLSSALPVWTTLVQREREAELVFRGEQYARAIALYQRAFGTAPPPSLDALVEEGFLRRRYADPMVPDGEFVPLTAGMLEAAGDEEDGPGVAAPGASGVGGIIGVTSRSTGTSLREYKGARQYNEWLFLAADFSGEAGTRGGPAPGGGPGRQGGMPDGRLTGPGPGGLAPAGL